MSYAQLPGRRRPSNWRFLLILVVLLLLGARTIASTIIEYSWWQEMGQVPVWIAMLIYGVAPIAAASLLAFAALWLALARGAKFGGVGLGQMPLVATVGTLGALLVGIMIASATIDSWAVIRYIGSRGLGAEAGAWRDPVFSHPLSFYLFDLPFYAVLRRYLLAVSLAAAVVYWLSARVGQLRDMLPQMQQTGEFDFTLLRLQGGLESRFLRGAATVFFIALAWKFYLDRYQLLFSDHGFMVGVDYVDQMVRIPLIWASVIFSLVAPVVVLMRRWKLLIGLAAVWILQAAVPPAVSALYVRPNEISIERPYIERHIQATRSAYGLDRKVEEREFHTSMGARINPADHRPLLDNVRLWDWRAFHDTVTQIQALRPYYVFHDTDVDRYTIDGKLRQVMLTPRELDISQLPDAQTRWINPHFIYTHGYGMVMAEANKITADGLPVLFVQDAPVRVLTDSLKLIRPEIYYGEVVHEPVFVRTEEKEFSYPQGDSAVFTSYEGTGGFPIAPLPMRLAAAISEADPNILLTGYFASQSRMMIHRKVADRLNTLAGFVTWDSDPYLVLNEDGRLYWMVDGYTTSDAHPYSNRLSLGAGSVINYIRNSVKATVDAYTGETHLYIFDSEDPIIQAYQKLFPSLLESASAMPAGLRKHARYPETFFRIQAEIYRVYHMTNPQTFYNKEDLWDVARNIYGQENTPQLLTPTYVVATLPGEQTPEFLLMLPFTPRTKDNLVGLMVARCDGEHLGELRVLQLSKQELVLGPMQIEARITQDQNISKDLTLWNQQGSQVLRGQILVLPIGDTILYVEPIYIQAAEARMPQLKKVVLALGDLTIYRDTYEQALSDLANAGPPGSSSGAPATTSSTTTPEQQSQPASSGADARIQQIREHLQRYRELAAQGKWADAGKELETIESLARERRGERLVAGSGSI